MKPETKAVGTFNKCLSLGISSGSAHQCAGQGVTIYIIYKRLIVKSFNDFYDF